MRIVSSNQAIFLIIAYRVFTLLILNFFSAIDKFTIEKDKVSYLLYLSWFIRNNIAITISKWIVVVVFIL